jgi:predicted phage terminase large subunit-like protein
MVIDAALIARLTERVDLQQSLRAFVSAAWHVVEPTPLIPGWHIDAICDHLEAVTRRDIRHLLINMPPRHGKSLILGVFWPAWQWTFDPSHRWLFASYGGSLAYQGARRFRRLIQSPWYRARWGHVFGLAGDNAKKAVREIENDQQGHRVSTSPGGEGTGRGGNTIAIDDPNKVKDAESERKREQTNAWVEGELPTRGDGAAPAFVFLQQRVHTRDVSGVILEGEQARRYVWLCLPAEYERDREQRTATAPNPLGFVDPRTDEGELLWPGGCPPEKLAEIKSGFQGDPYKIAGQLQQRPVPRDGGVLKRDWFVHIIKPEPHYDRLLLSGDLSHGSIGKSASHHAFLFLGMKGDAQSGLIDVIKVARTRATFPDAVALFESLAKEIDALAKQLVHPHAVADKAIENKASGRDLLQLLRGRIPQLVAVEPGQRNKVARLEDVAHLYRARRVRHLVGPWLDGFEFEIGHFPLAGADDQVDALSQGLEHLSRPTRSLVIA